MCVCVLCMCVISTKQRDMETRKKGERERTPFTKTINRTQSKQVEFNTISIFCIIYFQAFSLICCFVVVVCVCISLSLFECSRLFCFCFYFHILFLRLFYIHIYFFFVHLPSYLFLLLHSDIFADSYTLP